MSSDNNLDVKPERAPIVLRELGFGLIPWSQLAKQFGKVSKDERIYGITFKSGKYTYVLGKLYCGTQAETSRPYIGNHTAQGFFFDLEEDQAAGDLGVWTEDTDKRFDERRYAVVSDNPHEADIKYHVRPRFNAEEVYQRLLLARGPLTIVGFKDVDA